MSADQCWLYVEPGWRKKVTLTGPWTLHLNFRLYLIYFCHFNCCMYVKLLFVFVLLFQTLVDALIYPLPSMAMTSNDQNIRYRWSLQNDFLLLIVLLSLREKRHLEETHFFNFKKPAKNSDCFVIIIIVTSWTQMDEVKVLSPLCKMKL